MVICTCSFNFRMPKYPKTILFIRGALRHNKGGILPYRSLSRHCILSYFKLPVMRVANRCLPLLTFLFNVQIGHPQTLPYDSSQRYSTEALKADLRFAPTADARPSWQSTMQHVALEGRCFVLAANQFVRKSDYPARYQPDLPSQSDFVDQPDLMSPGGSVIYSRVGEPLAGPLWDREGLLTAELDFALLAKSKLDFDVTDHYSRPDVFPFTAIGQPHTIKL
jgi:hypothetical protein